MTTVVGYRVADWDTPLWISPNRSPTRWGTSGAIVQYWSTRPLTPWAEYFRGMNVRSADEAAEIILRPWAGELELPDDVVDLNFETAAGLGIAPDALVDDDWAPCQAVGGVPVRGEPVGPGTYRFEVQWGWLDPVSTTFDVRP